MRKIFLLFTIILVSPAHASDDPTKSEQVQRQFFGQLTMKLRERGAHSICHPKFYYECLGIDHSQCLVDLQDIQQSCFDKVNPNPKPAVSHKEFSDIMQSWARCVAQEHIALYPDQKESVNNCTVPREKGDAREAIKQLMQ